jgi:hypothetical protein
MFPQPTGLDGLLEKLGDFESIGLADIGTLDSKFLGRDPFEQHSPEVLLHFEELRNVPEVEGGNVLAD